MTAGFGSAKRRFTSGSKASEIAHHASEHDLTLKESALQLGYISEGEFDRIVDPTKMVHPYVAT